MSEGVDGSRIVCIHIEIEVSEDGFPVTGKSFSSWRGSVQHTARLEDVKHSWTPGDAEEALFNAFAALAEESYMKAIARRGDDK